MTDFPLWLNGLGFLVAAVLVWVFGTRLTLDVDKIAELTGIGRAFAGMLLLGTVTSLPEVASVTTSAVTGNPALATNNLLGSVAINVTLIALADAVLGRDALTSVVASPATMLHGALGITALAAATLIVLSGDVSILNVGLSALGLFAFCVWAFWLASSYADRAPWRAVSAATGEVLAANPREDPLPDGESRSRLRSYLLKAGGAAAVIFIAGFTLSELGDAIAKQTGLNTGIVGFVLIGFSTSLPEASSITAAVRIKRYEMALGDVFGTNLLTIGLILVADVFYRQGAILNEAGRFEATAALLGLVLTAIFLIGLLERGNRTIFRMGYDSLAAIVTFLGGLVLLYSAQGT
ncbi:MAG: sodium:calcium antiporter [Xanthobacteraceae bacterium]